MENPYLIVGLGNPGADYARTRHNVGFVVVERLAERWRASWALEKKFNARLARAEREVRRVLLCKPQTYMNSSGEAVRAVTAFYDVAPARVLVVMDDADLPLGHLRLRPSGSAGGHHGLESIEQHLGTREYPRLRVGIGRQEGAREITGHVLGRFGSTEAKLADKVLTVAADQAATWLEAGIQKAMSQFNGMIDDSVNEREDQ
jgi:peptidyl-tRNA hydrolase, PTH1 family